MLHYLLKKVFNSYTFAKDNQLIKLDEMNKNQLWKILSTLQKTPKNNQKGERLKYLESCTDDEIHAICGACKNFLCNNIQLTENKPKMAYSRDALLENSKRQERDKTRVRLEKD